MLAANPPIDLAACARRMSAPENRLYDWNFVRWLRAMVDRLHRRFPELGPPELEGVRTLYEFDDRYTARRNGFASADDYYERCSLVTSAGSDRGPRPDRPRDGRSVHPVRTVPAGGPTAGPRPRAGAARRAPGLSQPSTLAGRPSLARCAAGRPGCDRAGRLGSRSSPAA